MPVSIVFSRRNFVLSGVAALGLFPMGGAAGQDGQIATPVPCFTDAEREAVRRYWGRDGRYIVVPSPDSTERVNVTVEGSTWFHSFTKVVSACRKTDPITAAVWQGWWDQFLPRQKAMVEGSDFLPMDPGPAPQGLVDAIGFPCPALFYEKVTPTRYTVTFAPEDAPAPFVYEDGIDFGKRDNYYAYYRQRNGVIRPGRPVRDVSGGEQKHLEAIFARAGRSGFERRVLQAVSQYEGGFEAINTYDTGYISVGFIQFITAADGTGSLSEVLQRYKSDDPAGFQKDFRRFGIDVAPGPVLVCVNTVTGAELRGAEAVRQVIDDKRLTAVFERAAAFDGFRLAQVAVARALYWPGEDTFPLPSGAGTVRVADVVRSEAGMATLMDKKVNRGNIRDFADVAGRIMSERGLSDPRDLAQYERPIIAAMKYRGDFLSDATLSQPAPEPVPTPAPTQSASPASSSSPVATSSPVGSPLASPKAFPSASPSPPTVPAPSPSPSPVASPSPTPSPTPLPSPSPSPATSTGSP